MYDEKILNLLGLNGIDIEVFNRKLRKTLLLGVFEVVCKEIKKQGSKPAERASFRKFKNKTIPTKRIIKQYAGCELLDDDCEEMATLLGAFFNTGDPRKKFDAI